MVTWLPFPFLRLSLAWLAGVWLATSCDLNDYPWQTLWLGFALGFLILTWIIKRQHFHRWKVLLGLLALSSIFLAAVVRVSLIDQTPDLSIAHTSYYWGRVVASLKVTPKYHQYQLEIESVASQVLTASSNSNGVICYLKLPMPHLQYGDRILVKGAPSLIRPPPNPYQFDYSKFQQRRGVYWQHWLDSSNIMLRRSNPRTSLRASVFSLRRTCKQQIEKYLPSGPSQEIAGAMLLGMRRDISPQVKEAFAGSGTMHLLAVSGLHLGIIYGVLLLIFGRWRHHVRGKWVFLVLVLTVLWLFTLLTGLSPSTRRAAIMFSVLLLGKQWNRQGNSYNALAFSAFIILLIDPWELYSVGFQLSYLALSGILFLQPKISPWLKFRYRVPQYIWDLITVSFSAQLAVLPLTLYYFHQTSLYFLLGNMVLVPLAFAILVAGFCFLIAAPSAGLSTLLAKPVNLLLEFVHAYNQWLAQLPGAMWKEVWISTWQVLLCYGLLICGIRFLQRWRIMDLRALLVIWAIGLMTTITKFHQVQPQHQVVVYHLAGATVVDMAKGSHYLTYQNLPEDAKELRYGVTPGRFHNSWRPGLELPTIEGSGWQAWWFRDKLILLLDLPVKPNKPVPIKVDLLIVTGKALKSYWNWIDLIECDKLIVDGSVDRASLRKFKNSFNKQSQLYFTSIQGAFIEVLE